MAATEVYLSLGSNQGNRERNIKIAINFLNLILGDNQLGKSEIRETEAVGFDGAPFLNCVVKYRTTRSPMSLLSVCKHIEKQMGRTDKEEYDSNGKRIYHDRKIDIDILLYGNQHIDNQKLTIPHKALGERPFLKEMLDEITAGK